MYLPKYEWIFYLDSDIAIANVSILLEDFIHRFPNDTYIAFTDGHYGFNAGGFFIRNVPWSYWLLDQWWAAGDTRGSHSTCDSLLPKFAFQYTRCMFRWNDQVWAPLSARPAQNKADNRECRQPPSLIVSVAQSSEIILQSAGLCTRVQGCVKSEGAPK